MELILPTLEALKELGGSAAVEELNVAVIRRLQLPDEHLEQPWDETKDVRSQLELKLTWTRTILKNSGLIDNSTRGVWSLRDPQLSAMTVDPEAVWRHHKSVYGLRSSNVQTNAQKPERTTAGSEILDDEVRPVIPTAFVGNYQDTVGQRLQAMSASGFERFCQRLLREAGFQEVTVTGRSGDGGIDGIGILQINPLVSFKVLFQCKRYAGSVGAGHIRDFRGAMSGRADKGIIITTGSFTSDARREAVRDGVAAIELVDREKLIEMLQKLELGLKPITTYEVDARFFAEFDH